MSAKLRFNVPVFSCVLSLSFVALAIFAGCQSYYPYPAQPREYRPSQSQEQNPYSRPTDSYPQPSGQFQPVDPPRPDRVPYVSAQNIASGYPSAQKEYIVYDPQHPEADEYGCVHLTVQKRSGDESASTNPTTQPFVNTQTNQRFDAPVQPTAPSATPAFDRAAPSEPTANPPAFTADQAATQPQFAPQQQTVASPTVTNAGLAQTPQQSFQTNQADPYTDTTAPPLPSEPQEQTWITTPPQSTATAELNPYLARPVVASDKNQADPLKPTVRQVRLTGPVTTGQNTTPARMAAQNISSSQFAEKVDAYTSNAERPTTLSSLLAQSAQPDLQSTAAQLEQYLREHPENIQAQLALRLMYAAYGDEVKALREFPDIPMEHQQETLSIVRAMLLTAKTNTSDNANAGGKANQALQALQELSEQVADKADLQISCMKVCDQVLGFGQYDEIAAADLASGKPRQVLVYCELKNFTAQKNQEGKYYTQLHAEITLFDQAWRIIGTPLSADVTDTPSFNQRQDFFLRGPLEIPQLSPGTYEIVVNIEDKTAAKRARPQRIRFEVKPSSSAP